LAETTILLQFMIILFHSFQSNSSRSQYRPSLNLPVHCAVKISALNPVDTQSVFRRNILPPSSGSNNKRGKKAARNRYLLGSFLDPEDGGDMFVRIVDRLSMDYKIETAVITSNPHYSSSALQIPLSYNLRY
jgi:hypothetical protein